MPDLPPLERLTLPGESVVLKAVACGDPDGPLVVLLHGFPEGWYGWRSQLGPLAEAGFRVVALDQRGYGASEKPPRVADYVVDRLAADVASAITGLGATRAHVVGHDWGGAVAWWLALTRPHKVVRMAVLNCPHPTVMRTALVSDPRQLVRSWYVFGFQLPKLPEWWLRRNDFAALERSLRDSAKPGSFSDEDFDEYRKGWAKKGALTAMVNWYRAAVSRPSRPDDPWVRVPTLVVWGEGDRFLRTKLAHDSVALCERGRLEVLEDATHWVQHDAADEVNELLIEFLEE